VLQEAGHPRPIDVLEVAANVRVQNPAHLSPPDRERERVQRLMR
jgi:hypothetical protein